MSLEKALWAAKQFGGESETNNLPSWTKDDRESISYYYGVKWSDIPLDHKELLLGEYRKGEELARAKTYAERIVTEVTLDWRPVDWKEGTYFELVKKCEEMLDANPSLYDNTDEAKLALEKLLRQ